MPAYCCCRNPACAFVNHPAGQACTVRTRKVASKCHCCTIQVWDDEIGAAAEKHPTARSFQQHCEVFQNERSLKRKHADDFTEQYASNFTEHHATLIHRVWIHTGAVDEDPAARFMLQLGLRGMQCLKTWEPCRQWFWVYYMSVAEVDWLETQVKGLKVQFIQPHQFHHNSVAALLTIGAPMDVINNLLSLTLLHMYGGIYADLDIIWLGVPFPLSGAGYMFGQEPPARTARSSKSSSTRLTLSILAAPKGSAPIYALYQQLLAHWQTEASKAVNCKGKATCLAASSSNVLEWNQDAMTEAVYQVPHLRSAVCPPIVLQPLSSKVNAKQIAEAAGAKVDDAIHTKSNFPSCPSMATVLKYSVVICIWMTQWPAELQATLLSWVEAHRGGNPAAVYGNTYAELQSQLQTHVLQLLPKIQGFIPLGDAYVLVGCALQLLERNWSEKLFMEYTRLWPDGRPPEKKGLTAKLPKRATELTPEIWARVLLLWALGTKAGAGPTASCDASEKLQDYFYKSNLESGKLPFITVKATLAMFSNLYFTVELPG